MAIFVEGYTEVVFVDKLIREIASQNTVRIQWRGIFGGTSCPRRNYQIQAEGPLDNHKYFIVIHDCGGDAAVKSRMMEEYSNLVKAGYSTIVCIRDVYPTFTQEKIPALRTGLKTFVPTKPVAVIIILSIMEVEAWFLAEYSHFERIDSSITLPAIRDALQFDPSVDEMQLRPSPAEDMKSCYALGGKVYSKGEAKVTVDALDCAHIFVGLADKFPDLKQLCDTITLFLRS